MEIIRIRRKIQLLLSWDMAEIVCFACACKVRFPILLCFLIRFSGKASRYDIIRFPVLGHEIHRNHGELERCSSLKEEYLIVVWNTHNLSEFSFCVLDDLVIDFASMAHFHDRHTGVVVIKHLTGCFFQYRNGQHGWTCGEIKNS